MANKAPVWYLPGPFTRYNEDVKALAQKSGVRIVDARFVPENGRKDAAPEKDLPKVTEKKAPAKKPAEKKAPADKAGE
ncbi:MAG: hypothetical protein ABNH42_04400 [Marinobacter sp.]|jgi:hypothetical protein|uniref:hypothetical protein n=1 Tax=Gammaproteobacteria TaxID=1236 RepID=UPI0030D75C69|tara:strand:- start:5961 stop:6194 length:234 start_codon:yes stop_codon:yes gene_type:complete